VNGSNAMMKWIYLAGTLPSADLRGVLRNLILKTDLQVATTTLTNQISKDSPYPYFFVFVHLLLCFK